MSRLVVSSPWPNLQGTYVESGCHEGKPAFVRDAASSVGANTSGTWIFYSAAFRSAACWYFSPNSPQAGALRSLCCSADAPASPEVARWPPEDIIDIRFETLPAKPPVISPQQCADYTDLPVLSEELTCAAGTPISGDSKAQRALCLLKGKVSEVTLKKLATSLESGDVVVRQRLEDVVAVHRTQDESQDPSPLILVDPPASLEIGAGLASILCEGFSFSPVKLQYQWSKDGVDVHRAERAHLRLSGTLQDEGCYVCHVFTGCKSNSVTSRPCDVRLSTAAKETRASEASKRARLEESLHRADQAEQSGRLEEAIALLLEAINAAGDNEGTRLNAVTRRSELLFRLSRWQEAFEDASMAVKISPSLARAHASRGAAAEKLGLLAEAASSWETADILGGIPEASQRAKKCRERLEELFNETRPTMDANFKDTFDPESEWQRAGYGGRHTGGFFGGGGFFRCGGGNRTAGTHAVSEATHRDLELLGLAVDASGNLPSLDDVKKAYRKLVLQAHPDKGGSKEAFQKLQNAYEAILNAAAASA